MNLVPLLEVVLSVDGVLSPSSIELLGVVGQGSHARLMAILYTLRVDHSVWSGVTRSMTGALVQNAEVLTLLLRLVELLVGGALDFAIRPIDLETSH